MAMQYPRKDPGHQRIATLDIETTHSKPSQGEIVSIGVGVHDREEPGEAATYDTFHRDSDGEAALIRRAVGRLTEYAADGLVTYNGIGFDMDFIGSRLEQLGETVEAPEIATTPERHLDLYVDRKQRADQEGAKWPSLEECLEAYGYPCPVTKWSGEEITARRFGEEIGPAYLRALVDDSSQASALKPAIEHYLTTDLEANIAIYYADIGEDFEPYLLGTEQDY
jgi:hypothetical protein